MVPADSRARGELEGGTCRRRGRAVWRLFLVGGRSAGGGAPVRLFFTSCGRKKLEMLRGAAPGHEGGHWTKRRRRHGLPSPESCNPGGGNSELRRAISRSLGAWLRRRVEETGEGDVGVL